MTQCLCGTTGKTNVMLLITEFDKLRHIIHDIVCMGIVTKLMKRVAKYKKLYMKLSFAVLF